MTSLSKILFGAVVAAAVAALSVVNASATIVCAGTVCWHTHSAYDYPPDASVIVHPDDWHWGPSEHFSWREHEGRGYWHGDRWMEW